MKKVNCQNEIVVHKKRGIDKSEAVSPVVGVMLMLVVTLIISAIVSGFAGAIPDTTYQPSNVAMKATYSQTDGLTVIHMGGDAIGTFDTIVTVRLSDTFGDVEHVSWRIDPSDIVIKRGAEKGSEDAWMTEIGSSGVYNFAAGDIVYIEPDPSKYNTGKYLQNGLKSSNQYSFDNASNIGKEFWLELSDTSGKLFSKARVIITP